MKKNKNIILTAIAILIMAGVVYWLYSYWQSGNYYTTDNAKVAADLRSVSPSESGEIVKWDVSVGSAVKENEVIGRLNNGSEMKSPINGAVVKSNVVLNQMVSPTVVAAVIADTSDVYVQANVEETSITRIKVGQETQISLDAYPGKKFKGHVEEIDNVTVSALSGNATSFSTSGTYTKVMQLIPVKVVIDDEVPLKQLIGTNATIKINCSANQKLDAAQKNGQDQDAQGKAIEASGRFKANKTKNITMDFSATVKDVPVISGQRVGLGAVLMTLDLQDINKQIANQENNLRMEQLQLDKLANSNANSAALESSTVRTAEEGLSRAKDELAKQDSMYQAGAVSKQVYVDAQRRVADAEQALKDARISKASDYKLSMDIERQKIASIEADLSQLKGKLNKGFIKGSSVVSEFRNGLVESVGLVSGDIFMSNTNILKLVDLDSLVVEAEVPEHLVKGVKVGSKVDIMPVSDSGRTYAGKVLKVADMGIVKDGETVVLAEISIDNPDASIRPNFNVDVRIAK